MYIYIYIHIYIFIFIFYILFLVESFHPIQDLRLSFHLIPYMVLMFIRSRSHVKASMVLTRADHLSILNYIRYLLIYIYTIFIITLSLFIGYYGCQWTNYWVKFVPPRHKYLGPLSLKMIR